MPAIDKEDSVVNEADVVIVGAGHAGATAATALRQNGFDGSVLIIGREPDLPYERPPLSKEYLAREKPFERLLIRPAAYWTEHGIEMRLGEAVVSVDPANKTVTLESGDSVAYGKLVWAAGGDPRTMSCAGADLRGVHSVRTRADVDRMMAELDGGAKEVVIIGGGYIGLEAAAVLSKLDCSITLLEALPRILARVAGPELSAFFEQEHRAHGVDLRTEVSVDCIVGDGGTASGVRLADGTVLPAEMVIVGIGIIPAVAPLVDAGAAVSNGVDVDGFCQTSLADIYAIGDCAAHLNHYAGGKRIRLESVQNANDMATTVAKEICGTPQQYHALPWFWSNQFDLRLQTAGLSLDHDLAIVRGNPADRSFSVLYLQQGQIIAIDAVSAVKDYVQARKLIDNAVSIDPALLANTEISLKEMAGS